MKSWGISFGIHRRISTDDLPSRSTVVEYTSWMKTRGLHATAIALTGNHWTSVSNHNYLGVTAHLAERHYAEMSAEHFMDVAKQWNIEQKVTTLGTDRARNVIAAARHLPFEHMSCTAHKSSPILFVTCAEYIRCGLPCKGKTQSKIFWSVVIAKVCYLIHVVFSFLTQEQASWSEYIMEYWNLLSV